MTKFFLQFIAIISIVLALDACSGAREREEDNPDVGTGQQDPNKMMDVLLGEWRLDSAAGAQGGADEAGQTIRFTNEARYIVQREGQKVDSGAYRMNEQLKNLYLESEANEQPREYELKIEGTRMVLIPENGPQTQYIYNRISQ